MMRLAGLLLLTLLMCSVSTAQTYKSRHTGAVIDSAVDQALPKYTMVAVWDSTVLTTTRKYSFYNTMGDSIKIDTVMAYGSTTANLTLQLYYTADRSAAGTAIFASAQTVNSSTAGNKFTTFDHAVIPTDQFLYATTPAITTAPRELVVVFRFHRHR
jgi:hypothetical protein